MTTRYRLWGAAIALASGLTGFGCGCGGEAAMDAGSDTGSDLGGMDGSDVLDIPEGGIEVGKPDGGTFVCYVTPCSGHVLQCGDCTDNDGDGHVDSRDPECLGPCDNTEGPMLNAGVGGETGGPCRSDCYFDFGNGPGNDDCYWDHRCDPLSVAPDYPPEGPSCPYTPSLVGSRDCPATQSAACLDFCRPITPNGCDCFGCCTFPELAGRGPGGSDGFVWIQRLDSSGNGTCSFAGLTDPAACPPCTPVADCFNACGTCEVCVGRPIPPPECSMMPDGGTPPPRCDPGVQPCGLPGDMDCAMGYYCITGCCQLFG